MYSRKFTFRHLAVVVFGLGLPFSASWGQAPATQPPAAAPQPPAAAPQPPAAGTQPAAAASPEEVPTAGENPTQGKQTVVEVNAAPSQQPGQNDLDEAVQKRFDADDDEKLQEVSLLVESAIKKGLDPENLGIANQMLGSVLFERAQRTMPKLMRMSGRRAIEMTDEVIGMLDKATISDPSLVEAYLLKSRLSTITGDLDQGLVAANKAVELLGDSPIERSEALLLRSLTRTNDVEKLADLDEAAKLNPDNTEIYQQRAALRIKAGDVEGGIADMEKVLLENPGNQQLAELIVLRLEEMNKVDRAVALLTKVIDAEPSEEMYRLRAQAYRNLGDNDKATADLDQALKLKPSDPLALLLRAEVALTREDLAAAKSDLKSAMDIAPQLQNNTKALALKAQIAIAEKRYSDAIATINIIAEGNPEEPFWKIRLATLYTMDKRPRKAVEVLTNALSFNATDGELLRARGDALLSVGDHVGAINDYEAALKSLGNIEKIEADQLLKEEASGLYNNLAWVLSTSPTDSVRSAERSLSYGKKAAELTGYKEAHILSTLAAAHAENGNFEEARKWSEKAVEMAKEEDQQGHSQIEQLKKELDSYKKNEPWREKQEEQENNVPLLAPEDLIDA
jgi:tetratricopeptide (TPR) repeat protein